MSGEDHLILECKREDRAICWRGVLSSSSLLSLQLKILRSKDRVDGQGIGRSKGFAFVEFSTHDSALTALRAINNNPQILGPNKVHCTNHNFSVVIFLFIFL